MWWYTRRNQTFFRRNGRVHLNRRWRQFSRLLAAEVCASAVVILDTPCSEAVWRVLATHSIRQFPLHFPSSAVCHHISAVLLTQLHTTHSETKECLAGIVSVGTETTERVRLKIRLLHFCDKKELRDLIMFNSSKFIEYKLLLSLTRNESTRMGTLFFYYLYLHKWLTLTAKRCFLFLRVCTEYKWKFIKVVLIIKPTRCTNFSNVFLE